MATKSNFFFFFALALPLFFFFALLFTVAYFLCIRKAHQRVVCKKKNPKINHHHRHIRIFRVSSTCCQQKEENALSNNKTKIFTFSIIGILRPIPKGLGFFSMNKTHSMGIYIKTMNLL